MESLHFLELKNLLLEQREMLNLLIPKKGTVSFISETTGVSRQTITSYLKANFEPYEDYEKKNGKIFLSKTTTIALLQRYNNDKK